MGNHKEPTPRPVLKPVTLNDDPTFMTRDRIARLESQREDFIAFAKWAKSYKSSRVVEDAWYSWLKLQ